MKLIKNDIFWAHVAMYVGVLVILYGCLR